MGIDTDTKDGDRNLHFCRLGSGVSHGVKKCLENHQFPPTHPKSIKSLLLSVGNLNLPFL